MKEQLLIESNSSLQQILPDVPKNIPGYGSRYLCYSDGRIVNSETCRTLRYEIIKGGYRRISLSLNGKVTRYSVHRIVAFLFCYGYFPRADVNHKDLDTSNNNYLNLEWVTRSENEKHKYANTNKRPPDSKLVINNETLEVFPTISSAAKSIGMKMTTLSAMLNNDNPNKTSMTFI